MTGERSLRLSKRTAAPGLREPQATRLPAGLREPFVGAQAGPQATGSQPLGTLLMEIYDRLLAHFGPLHWWPAETPFEVVVGAVLTQNTAWTNVEKAIANLKHAVPLTRESLIGMPLDQLAQLIRPSGYYSVKAARLRTVLEWLGEGWEERLATGDLDDLRRSLLTVWGVGAETADSILLYAAGRPTFVIDAYTRRICERLGIEPGPPVILSACDPFPSPLRERTRVRVSGRTIPTPWVEASHPLSGPKHPSTGLRTGVEGGPWRGYEDYRRLFMDSLPYDTALYNEYHAQLVYLGKDYCLKHPRCAGCPLLPLCPTGNPNLPSPSGRGLG